MINVVSDDLIEFLSYYPSQSWLTEEPFSINWGLTTETARGVYEEAWEVFCENVSD